MGEKHLNSLWRCLREPIDEWSNQERRRRVRGIPYDTTRFQRVGGGETLGEKLVHGENIFLGGGGEVHVREQTE